jgi:hypothetical protein
MRKLALLFCASLVAFSLNAQLETPQPSPASKLEQKVGLTDITISYSRPGVKGRTIFGSLEPYGKVWRTGANANTTISFSTDVNFAGTDVKAGTYAIYVIPNKDNWEVMLYNETSNWGVPRNWDESKIVAKTTADVTALDWVVETFTIDINNIKHDSATLDLIWEKSYVVVPFSVPTDQIVSAAIEKTMAGPGPDDYYSAAVYKLAANKDLDQAMAWIDKAVDMTSDQPRFWYLRQQSLIHAANGDKDGAIKAAKASLEGAKKAGNDGYIKMNTDSLKEWGAM